MAFSSLEFIFIFLPVFLAVYYIFPARARAFWVLCGSFIFYAFSVSKNVEYILLLAFSVLVNYILGLIIGKTKKIKGVFLAAGIVYNFFWLILFKYAGLFAPYVKGFDLTSLVLPAGISFYTFQMVGYLADVYRRTVSPERSIIRFGAYTVMFPKLLSGPITSYGETAPSLVKPKSKFYLLNSGLREFTIGLGAKVILADTVGSLWHNVNTIGFESISTPLAWMGIAAFSFQLYFDFYGYSKMAVGVGKMMGIKLPENFDDPYTSVSMTEFWRRWHITLGKWFKDYLYIPLGGSRRGFVRMVFNMLIVWLFTGLWHGSTVNFLYWGLFLFAVMFIEKLFLKKVCDRFRFFGHVYMIILIPLSWLLFAVTDISQLSIYVCRLFPFIKDVGVAVLETDFIRYGADVAVYFVLCLFFSTNLPKKLFTRFHHTFLETVVLAAIFAFSVYRLYMGMSDPFLYFNF